MPSDVEFSGLQWRRKAGAGSTDLSMRFGRVQLTWIVVPFAVAEAVLDPDGEDRPDDLEDVTDFGQPGACT